MVSSQGMYCKFAVRFYEAFCKAEGICFHHPRKKEAARMERMKKRFGILALIAVVTLAFVLVSAFASRMVYQNSLPAYYAEIA